MQDIEYLKDFHFNKNIKTQRTLLEIKKLWYNSYIALCTSQSFFYFDILKVYFIALKKPLFFDYYLAVHAEQRIISTLTTFV